jgi:hypothetical protein
MNFNKRSIFLLPTIFKSVGYIVLLFALIFLIVIAYYKIISRADFQPQLLISLSYIGIASGLLLIAFSSEIVETDSVARFRYEALFSASIIAISFTIILDIFNILRNDSQINAVDLIIIILALYLLLFQYRIKKHLRNYAEE